MENRTLTDAHITAYARSLREEERAPATIEKYLRNLRFFSAWPVTKDLAARWKESLLAQGLTPATVNGRLAAVNGLFCFLGWNDCRVRALKVQRKVFRDGSRDLSRGEYKRLVETALRLKLEWLALVMETICSTGIRVSEVRFITVEAAMTRRADVMLKGKLRTILLPDKLCRKLLKFAGKEKIVSGEIFLAEDGKSISRCRIWREMKALCKAAGVESSKVFPHNLRHLFAVCFYRAARDIVKLADMLGHSSINTTRIYLLSTGAEHARQLEKLGLVS